MNRKQLKKFIKVAKNRKISSQMIELFLRLKEGKSIEPIEPIKEGDKVRLNLPLIQSRSDYSRLSEFYKGFVASNEDTIFTVEYDTHGGDWNCVVCLKEDPAKWLFWVGDLIRVNK